MDSLSRPPGRAPQWFRALAGAVVACASLLVAHPASAQKYPDRPITLVVPFAAGGPTDVVARTLAVAMTKTLGQTIIVENRTGAGGTIAASFVARAQPNGYTLLIHHNGMATAPALYRKLSFDPLGDFEYVGQVVDVPMTLLGRKDLPPNNVPELTTYLKANKDKLNLANAGLGAVSHLCGMLVQQAVGVELTTVPFQGTAPAMAALMAGQVDVLCDQTTQTIPQIKAGNVKLYGVTTADRIAALPDAPTLNEAGLKGFQMMVWHGVYAPKGTPPEIVATLTQALQTSLKDPALQKHIADLGSVIVPVSKQTPDGLRSWLKAEIDRMGPLIRKAGVYAD